MDTDSLGALVEYTRSGARGVMSQKVYREKELDISNARQVPVVVVGLCAHGLATVRALAKAGLQVHAVEANMQLPGVHTRLAKLHLVDDINGPNLVGNLKRLHEKEFSDSNPVLLLTNDNMVRMVGLYGTPIAESFRISWFTQRDAVIKYIDKVNIEKRCDEVGLKYPKTRIIESESAFKELKELRLPLIAKPSKPLSSFKTHKVRSYQEAESFLLDKRSDWPILIQEWIDGGDESLFFCGVYLAEEGIHTYISGKKIESYPPAMGQTLIGQSIEKPDIEKLTRDFFDDLDLRGPASLEFKQDKQGDYWVIEPTLGRTDYWLDCVVEAGANIPLMEYCDATGQRVPVAEPFRSVVWYDTEKDPRAYVRHVLRTLKLKPYDRKPVYPFFGHGDFSPYFYASVRLFKRQLGKLSWKKPLPAPVNQKAEELTVKIYHSIADFAEQAEDVLKLNENKDICLSEFWFSCYERNIVDSQKQIFYVLVSRGDSIRLVFPFYYNRRAAKNRSLPLWTE